jgi:hypothetical protein
MKSNDEDSDSTARKETVGWFEADLKQQECVVVDQLYDESTETFIVDKRSGSAVPEVYEDWNDTTVERREDTDVVTVEVA